jgi:hypothetical protein
MKSASFPRFCSFDRQILARSVGVWYYATNQRREVVAMLYLFLGAGLFLLPILLRLAVRLRLGIPILYALGMLTVFHSWYQANTALADGIFFALVGLTALSWVVTAARKVYGWLDERLAEQAAAHELADRVRQARANGESAVSTDGVWC